VKRSSFRFGCGLPAPAVETKVAVVIPDVPVIEADVATIHPDVVTVMSDICPGEAGIYPLMEIGALGLGCSGCKEESYCD